MPATPPSINRKVTPAMPVITLTIRPRRLRSLLLLTATGVAFALTGTAVAKADTAQWVCDYITAGHSRLEATATLVDNNPGLTADAAAAYVGEALATDCPQFHFSLVFKA